VQGKPGSLPVSSYKRDIKDSVLMTKLDENPYSRNVDLVGHKTSTGVIKTSNGTKKKSVMMSELYEEIRKK
jgi:hypothetical protein